MGINFSPFEIGQRALRASQLGLTVAGQNIANVNTPGYTRQEVQLAAAPPSGANPRLTGNGVTIEDVRSFRDQFIETRLQTESGISGRLQAKRDTLESLDAALNPASNNITTTLTDFFGAFRTLEANPTSVPLRTVAIESGKALGNAFNSTRARLEEIRANTDGLLRIDVEEANQLAGRIASLTASISVAENTGAKASELRDQRSQAIQSLTELTGTRTTENEDGTLTLTLADGRPLVLADRASTLQTSSTAPNGLATITLDGQPATINSGRVRGLQESIGLISSQITGLDELAAAVATRVNTAHLSGVDLDGNAGTTFFAVPNGGAPITAANLAVSASVSANPRRVVSAAAGAGNGDGSVARNIAELLSDNSSQAGTRTGSFSSIYGSLVSEAGQAIKTNEDALVTQQAILAQVTAQREAASGVSLDEEAVNLLRYQRAFEAAARLLKVADEITQTVIALGQ
ncbi:MAG: flagellar hook-associated protein FlgK [Acidobacteriota bacterium]